MKNKKILKIIFPLIVIALLLPWPIAYSHDVSDGVVGEETVQVEVAEPSAMPSWKAFGKAIGGVEAGDLFYIDATDSQIDIQVNLYITNTQELIHCYRYMNLEVGIYIKDGTGEWEKALSANGEPTPDTFITLRNGQVSFTLAGYANYKVTIDGGCFNCITTNADGGSLSPQFYLEVE